MKKCKVIINQKEETINADFYGVYQKAWTHGDSLISGMYKARQIAHPVAVVDWGEGLKEVKVNQVVEVQNDVTVVHWRGTGEDSEPWCFDCDECLEIDKWSHCPYCGREIWQHVEGE